MTSATKTSLRLLGQMGAAQRPRRPGALPRHGVGPVIAATLLVAVGDNRHRMRSEAAFAHLCGVAPIPAMSGQVTGRVRLDRGGNRDANGALWRIAFCRMHSDDRTRASFARRLAEGRSRKEIIRCLQRYVAREMYPLLVA